MDWGIIAFINNIIAMASLSPAISIYPCAQVGAARLFLPKTEISSKADWAEIKSRVWNKLEKLLFEMGSDDPITEIVFVRDFGIALPVVNISY